MNLDEVFDSRQWLDDILNDENQEKQRSIETCGTYMARVNGHTGEKSVYQWTCHYFRDCPHCQQRRIEEEEKAIKDTLSRHQNLYQILLPEATAVKLMRKVGKDNYKRYPIDLSTDDSPWVLLVSDQKITIGGHTPVSEALWQHIDIRYVASCSIIPEGTRLSGNLYQNSTHVVETEPGNDELYETVSTAQYVATSDLDRAWEIARTTVTQSLVFLRPSSAQGLIDFFENTLKDVCAQLDIELFEGNRISQTLYLPEVNWGGILPFSMSDVSSHENYMVLTE